MESDWPGDAFYERNSIFQFQYNAECSPPWAASEARRRGAMNQIRDGIKVWKYGAMLGRIDPR